MPAFHAQVKERDRGLKMLLKRARKAAREEGGVGVGVFDTSPRLVRSIADRPLTNVQVAAIMEFGTSDGRIPARSFLRATADDNRKKYLELLEKAHEKVILKGADWRQLLGLVGEIGVADVKARITSQEGFAPLAASTIRRKGSSQALIDTGQLRASITPKIIEGAKPRGHHAEGHGE